MKLPEIFGFRKMDGEHWTPPPIGAWNSRPQFRWKKEYGPWVPPWPMVFVFYPVFLLGLFIFEQLSGVRGWWHSVDIDVEARALSQIHWNEFPLFLTVGMAAYLLLVYPVLYLRRWRWKKGHPDEARELEEKGVR